MADKKKIIYHVYSPEGWIVRTCTNRKEVKAFIEGLNFNIPSWHYDKLYKMQAEVTESDEICHA